ncbi:MAG: CDP-diacylglycerol---glycerol-3-phosphate 3-phosphatidyltransferase [Frankiales bacterium]|jgi:CDP-diacylglycerol--glycerol-3-phosphate 3-phosphatidyltransferase|nr:CDP-diacylglycerol---glycerol-3-phosphate 3-phosphatidyltransferase [Frankiales bacterium]
MDGLYAFKPWYAARLTPLRRRFAVRGVTPNAVTAAGVVFAAGAGAVLALVRPGWWAALAVTALLAARLACANLDGALARETRRTSAYGSVVNEFGDRAADLAALAGCLVLAPPSVVATAAFASTLPSWVALAGAAAGANRVNGGPVGKTERAALLVVIALTGAAVPILIVLATGSVLTAALRLRVVRRALVGGAS